MMREVFNFDAVARLGLMEVVLRECGSGSGWGKPAGASGAELSNSTKRCVLRGAAPGGVGGGHFSFGN